MNDRHEEKQDIQKKHEPNDQAAEGFSYVYSAREQAEIRRIRERYAPQEVTDEDKLTRLRRLDARATQKAQTWSLVIGVIGALILGLGMSLVMSDLGVKLDLPANLILPLGIGIGVVGCIPVALAYPLYEWIIRRERARIAPEVLRLTEELMK